MKTNSLTMGKAYCIRGQQQMSLFNEKTLVELTPLCKRRNKRKLFALIEAPDGYSWWQEIERLKGETPWQACIRYRNETLGRGYWICTWELRSEVTI